MTILKSLFTPSSHSPVLTSAVTSERNWTISDEYMVELDFYICFQERKHSLCSWMYFDVFILGVTIDLLALCIMSFLHLVGFDINLGSYI